MTEEATKKQQNVQRDLWITYINIVLYAMCFQLQRPVEPFLVKDLAQDDGTTHASYGKLQSFFSVLQTLGSPVVGVLLDRVGIKWASAIVFLASALSYGILSQAQSMEILFLSKVPTALQAAFLVAQATAATADNEIERTQALGRMTTAYTIGATLGPALGGKLAEHGDLFVGAKLAVAGSLLSVVLSITYLPGITRFKDDSKNDPTNRSALEEVHHSLEVATRPTVWPLLTVKVFSGVATSLIQTAMPLVLTSPPFDFDPGDLGIFMSSSMFASAMFSMFGLALLTRFLGGANTLTRFGLSTRPVVAMLLGAALMGMFGKSKTVMVSLSVVLGLASHCIATGLTTQTTGVVEKSEQGTILGLEHALFSMARIGAPTLATSILGISGFGVVGLSSACLDLLLLGLLMFKTTEKAKPT